MCVDVISIRSKEIPGSTSGALNSIIETEKGLGWDESFQ